MYSLLLGPIMLSKRFKRKQPKPVSQSTQSTQLWTEVSPEQQENMKGGYPWPGYPPAGGDGGALCDPAKY